MDPSVWPMRLFTATLFVGLWALSLVGTAAEPESKKNHLPPIEDLWSQAGEDWGQFLGPTGNGKSGLATMAVPWPAGGPKVVWHCALGQGYCAPAVASGRAVLFDRIGAAMRLRCLHAQTGQLLWETSYPADYTDSFGYDGGPRASPVIAGDRVLTYGPEGRLECRSLADGASLWHVETSTTYSVVKNFFGVGAAPLVVELDGREKMSDRLVVVQVGGSRPGSAPAAPERLDLVKGLDSGLVAFDLATGQERWRASSQLASYSSPITAQFDGNTRVLAWLRDKFLVVDPSNGAVTHEFRWRADELFSAIAASPVVVGNQVLLSETYGPGSVLLDLKAGGLEVLRKDRDNSRPKLALKAHWATPVFHDGYLYGSSGRNAGDAQLVCVDWKTGAVLWSEGGLGRSSVVLVGSAQGPQLIVLGEFGDLVLVEASPQAMREVSRARPLDLGADPVQPAAPPKELLVPPCWAAPVVAHGYLYVRGEGRLICLNLIAEE